MQKLLPILLITIITACQTPASSDKEDSGTLILPSGDTIPEEIITHEEEVEIIKEEEIIQPVVNTEIKIYRFVMQFQGDDEYFGFISLTDIYPWGYVTESEDSSIIDIKYRREPVIGKYNKHELKGEKRVEFLKNTGVSESESVFIYQYEEDKLYEFPVAELPVIAILNAYTSVRDFPVPDYYFQIGFGIPDEKLGSLKEKGWNSLTMIEDENPFKQGMARPMIFEEIGEEEFKGKKSADTSSEKVYLKFSHGDFDYYTHAGPGKYYYNFNLQVYNNKTGELILDRLYGRGEGSSATRIVTTDSENPNNEFQQWTGQILRGYPPIVFGLQSQSFGCEPVDFLDSVATRVYLRCDNRH